MSSSIFSDQDIDLIIELGRELTGTQLDRLKHSVVIHNLASRINQLGKSSLEEYLQFVEDHDDEMPYLTSALTIHTTSWFREANAFDQLKTILLKQAPSYSLGKPFRVLSVACSTGEEVYSIASILESTKLKSPQFDYSVEGWDVDPISLRTAKSGRYDSNLVQACPKDLINLIGRYELKQKIFSVHDHIKDKIRFRTVNIINPPELNDTYQFIFCRNMLIYFDSQQVSSIVNFLHSHLVNSGYFCTGVSETSALSTPKFKSFSGAIFEKIPSTNAPEHKSKLSLPLVTDFRKSFKQSTKILIVDDEQDILNVMQETLGSFGYDVDAVNSADLALDRVRSQDYGLILSDYKMPMKNGLQLCKSVKDLGFAGAFVIITGFADQKLTEQALQLKCAEVVLKPCVSTDLNRLVKHYIGSPTKEGATLPKAVDLMLFGSSTGGTEVLAKLLKKLPSDSPPIVIVQHISSGFAQDFANRLASISNLTLGRPKNMEVLLKGHIYLATGDYHIGVKQTPNGLCLLVSDADAIGGHRPAIDYLFCSAASTKVRIMAGILTGMGKDGAYGLSLLRQQGALTIAQDEKSCVVFGMPKEAIAIGGASMVCNIEEIRAIVEKITGTNKVAA